MLLLWNADLKWFLGLAVSFVMFRKWGYLRSSGSTG